MADRRRVLMRPWILLVGVLLLATHVIFFHRLWHAGFSLTLMAGLVLLVLAKHVGVFGFLHGLWRRRSRGE